MSRAVQDDVATASLVQRPSADGERVFALRGDIGTLEAVSFRAAVLPLIAAGQNLTLDCAGLGYLGGAGLQILLALRAELGHAGKTVSLTGVTVEFERALAQAGVTTGLTTR